MNTLEICRKRWFLAAACGLAACLALFGEGSGIGRRISVDTFAVMVESDPFSGGITIMGAFLLVALLPNRMHGLIGSRMFLVCVSTVNVIGCILLLSSMFELDSASWYPRAGGLILGFGSTLLLVCWAAAIVPQGARESSLCLAFAMIAVVIFDLVSHLLVDVGLAVVVVALCFASPLLLVSVEHRLHIDQEKASSISGIEEYRGVVPVWLSFASTFLYAVVMGGIQVGGSEANGLTETVASSGIAVDMGLALASFIIVMGVRFLRGNNMSFYRLTILALLAISLYLSSALPPDWSAAAIVIMTASRMLVFAYVWTMFSTPAKTMSPVRLLSIGWLLFLVPNNISNRLGSMAAEGGIPLVIYEMSLALALLVLFVFEFTPLLTDRSAEESADGAQSAEDAFAARIAVLVDQGGLTPRERDVLVALARGRSAKYIADTFVVSRETARTHIRHVYQKLDVHSREELMDLVELGLVSQ